MVGAGTMLPLALGLILASSSGILVVLGSRGFLTAAVFFGAMACLGVGIVRTVREEAARRADDHLVPPVPPPSRETLDELLEPVMACPECGTTDLLHAIHGHDGYMVQCPRCAYLGAARTFSRKEEYAKYVQQLAR